MSWEQKGYSNLVDDGDENRNPKGTRKCTIKQKIKLKDHKNCVAANPLKKIKDLEKKHSLRKSHKDFIKRNKLVSKSQQRFKSKKNNVFIKEFNENVLGANDDKIIQ